MSEITQAVPLRRSNPRPPRSRSWPDVAAIAMSVVLTASLLVLVAGLLASMARGDFEDLVNYAIFLLLPANLGFVGAVLVVKRPQNPVGWLLLVSGTLAGLAFAGGEYVRLAQANGGDWPLFVPAAWVSSTLFVPAIGLLVALLPLIFPTGHLLGPRWRWVALLGILGATIGALGTATQPGPLSGTGGPLNPLVPPEPWLSLFQALYVIGNLLAPPAFLLSIASVLIRFRRSRGVERQQIKWFLFAASITAIAWVISIASVGPISDFAWIVGLLSMSFLPLAIGLAILRYRLYDIDRIVSRAVGYTIVTALLAMLFVTAVLVAQALLTPVTESNGLAIAASTLLVASAFQPIRRRVQAVVDRRFDRARVDADRTIETFGTALRDETDLTTIDRRLMGVVTETTGPSRAALWLRPVGQNSGGDR